jgi:hypothetical protein
MRSFDSSLITVRNNPFANSRARAIEDGVFMKELLEQNPPYISNTDPYIQIGIINKLMEKIKQIEEGQVAQHILILGEYGQGKSFSLKVIQDELYINYNSAIISYSIGGNSAAIIQDDHYFQERIMEDIERLFQNLDPALYSMKTSIDQRYQLSASPGRTFHQFLTAYDHSFGDLQIQVYIFIDELDKVVLSTAGDSKISNFLENLKLIADICNHSISLIVAGTPNCLVKMNQVSIDYAQRFDIVENNFLTLDNTFIYITRKCATKLSHVGYYPFNRQVIKIIYSITEGNIRKIEAVCRELWLRCARDHCKIDLNYLDGFLQEKLFEPILNIMPSINNPTVKFIATCFINQGRISKSNLKNYPQRARQEIQNLISVNEDFRTVKSSYVMSSNLVTKIGDAFLN